MVAFSFGIGVKVAGINTLLGIPGQAIEMAVGNNEVAKNALRERAFEQQKKLRIAEATISGLTGAVDTFNSVQNLNKLIPGLGIAVGLGLAGTVAAITAQQIALIANSSFNNPSVSGVGCTCWWWI